MSKSRPVREAWSLIEVLIVIGLLGMLLGLTLPAVQQARDAAARASCLNQLRQIGVALHNFHDGHGRLPPLLPFSAAGSDPNALLGWQALILPQMDQEALYRISSQACRIDADPTHDPPHMGFSTVVKAYVCPFDGRLTNALKDGTGLSASYSSYVGIAGAIPRGLNQGLMGVLGFGPGGRFAEIQDGLSETLMVGERPPPDSLQAGWWYPGRWTYSEQSRGPNNALFLGAGATYLNDDGCATDSVFGPGRTENPCDRYHLWSLHRGGSNLLFADGSARFLTYSAEPLVTRLASRNGGEVVQLP